MQHTHARNDQKLKKTKSRILSLIAILVVYLVFFFQFVKHVGTRYDFDLTDYP